MIPLLLQAATVESKWVKPVESKWKNGVTHAVLSGTE